MAHLDEIEGVECPCGTSRRAFLLPENKAASVHQVDISRDAKPHYHTRLTEIYVVLEGEGALELDGKRVSVRPGTAVLIPPGVVHRAVGKLKILNVSVPPFDPRDEHVVPARRKSGGASASGRRSTGVRRERRRR